MATKEELSYVEEKDIMAPREAEPRRASIVLIPSDEKRLLRKIDFHLMPVMFILYLLQYLDKTSLGYTAIMGIIEDTASTLGSLIIFCHANEEISILLDLSTLGSQASSTSVSSSPVPQLPLPLVLWAAILMCMAVGKDFAGLSVLRTLLGVFEAAINPGFTIITSMFYRPDEHALRHGIWYGGASIAYIFGGILSYGISFINSSISTWKILFLLFGAITLAWGIAMYWLLPDNPQTARFLTPEERKQAFARVQGLRHSADSRKWNQAQFNEAMIDPRTWLLFLLAITVTLPGGGLTAFSSIITKSFGYDLFQTYLLGMATGGFLLFFVIFTVVISMYVKDGRCISIALLNIISLVGCLMVKLVDPQKKLTRLAGLWLIGGYASGFPTILSLISSNVTGHTKKAVVNAVLFLGFCTGYIIGPLTFIAKEAPAYPTAFNIMVACFCGNIAIIMTIRQIMAFANRKRDREYGRPRSSFSEAAGGEELDLEELDETDWQNKSIRYALLQPKKRFRARVAPDQRKRTAQACVACRKRKRKCLQQKNGICAQCREHQTTCYFETIPQGSTTDYPSRASFSHATAKYDALSPWEYLSKAKGLSSRWQVPPATQRQIEDQMKQLYPGLDLKFDLIRSAAMVMENFRPVGDADTADGGAASQGSHEHTSGEDCLDDFPRTILQAVGKPMESPSPTSSFDDLDIDHEAVSQVMLELPPWSTASTLIEAFFHYAESNWYYCDQARFWQRLTSLYEHGIESDEANPGFVCLTFMALALGCHFQHLPIPSKTYVQDGLDDNARILGSRASEMLREGDIKTPMPVYNDSLDARNPNKLIRLNAFIDLTKLHSSVARKSTCASSLEDILAMEQSLDSWSRNLPDTLRSHELGHMRATVHLQLMYNLIGCDLGRTQLLWLVKEVINRRVRPASDSAEYQQTKRLAKLCTSSAHTILRLIQSLRQVGMLASFSYTDFHASSAAVVILLLDSILHPRPGIADTVGSGIDTLEMIAAGNEYAQREDLPTDDTDPGSVDCHYDAADFAALEAIINTDSDLWDDDQTSQDLYFFGFGGVGPSIL
ncbi:hypothetical protein DV738_g460, partial [Chaetothyriales sp. CBS 135597]